MKKYYNFILERQESLRYYAFDVDDNLLFMSTKIHMDKKVNNEWIPVDVSTEKFAIVRNDNENYRIRNNNPQEAFAEFRDNGPRGNNAFLEDWIEAVNDKKFGPSWESFISCLVNGSLFAIITSRGHEPETIKSAVLWTIDNVLSKRQYDILLSNLSKFNRLFNVNPNKMISHYLNDCTFCGIQSKYYTNLFGNVSAEEAKSKGIQLFAKHIDELTNKIGYRAILGFSDDDPKFVDSIKNLMRNELSLKYINMGLSIVDTGNKGYKKEIIRK